MKKLLIIILFSLNTCFIANTFANQDLALDKVVAVINDDVVTQSELKRALNLAKGQLAQQHVQMSEDTLQKQVLDQLINKKLQLQIAKQGGLTIEKKEVEAAIDRIAKQNSMTSAELFQRLQQDGMNPKDYRNEIREQMTLRRLQQQEAVKNLNVSEKEINAFMHSKEWQISIAKEYQLQDILIPLSDSPTAQEIATAKERAQTTLAKLNQGTSVADVVKNQEKEKAALQTGDLGWRKLTEIPTAFSELVAKMQKNEFAGPIQTSNGFHIVQLTDVRNTDKTTEPSRKQVQEILMQRKFEEAVNVWVSKLRSQSFIKTDLAV